MPKPAKSGLACDEIYKEVGQKIKTVIGLAHRNVEPDLSSERHGYR